MFLFLIIFILVSRKICLILVFSFFTMCPFVVHIDIHDLIHFEQKLIWNIFYDQMQKLSSNLSFFVPDWFGLFMLNHLLEYVLVRLLLKTFGLNLWHVHKLIWTSFHKLSKITMKITYSLYENTLFENTLTNSICHVFLFLKWAGSYCCNT